MSTLLQGFLISIETSPDPRSRTDCYVYLGIQGSNGGGEFALDSERGSFSAGATTVLRAGEIPRAEDADPWAGWPPADPILGAREANHPLTRQIDFDTIGSIYLRKSNYPLRYRYRRNAGLIKRVRDDDEWQLIGVDVLLFGGRTDPRQPPPVRAYHRVGPLWLGAPYGTRVWIPPAPPAAVAPTPLPADGEEDRYPLG
jgi:hypothetical protein